MVSWLKCHPVSISLQVLWAKISTWISFWNVSDNVISQHYYELVSVGMSFNKLFVRLFAFLEHLKICSELRHNPICKRNNHWVVFTNYLWTRDVLIPENFLDISLCFSDLLYEKINGGNTSYLLSWAGKCPSLKISY